MMRTAMLMFAALAVTACADPAPEPDPTPPSPPPAPVREAPDPDGPPPDRPAVGDAAPMTVRVYFTRDEEPEPVEREIPRTSGVLRATLAALLEGPTDAERAAGLFSWFSEETAGMLRDVHVDEAGRAIVDFRDLSRIISGASSSAGGRILLNELNHTVFQFDTVGSVEYRMDGSCDRFWNWLQSDCGVVERP